MNGTPYEMGPRVNGHDTARPAHPADLVITGDSDIGTGLAEQWPAIDEPWPDPAVDEFEEQRARLLVEIAAANQRLAAARHAAAERDAEMRAALRNALVEVRAELTALESGHADRLAALREATADEVQRILDPPLLGVSVDVLAEVEVGDGD
jgi:hypothetical protein